MNEELRFQLPKKGRRGRERIYMPNRAWLRRSILGPKQSCCSFINAGARTLRQIEFSVIHAECPRKERDEGPAGILLASTWRQDLVRLAGWCTLSGTVIKSPVLISQRYWSFSPWSSSSSIATGAFEDYHPDLNMVQVLQSPMTEKDKPGHVAYRGTRQSPSCRTTSSGVQADIEVS